MKRLLSTGRLAVIVAVVGVGIPAGEWFTVRSDALSAAPIPSSMDGLRPSQTSQDLARLWENSRIGDSAPVSRPRRSSQAARTLVTHLKDPFAAIAYLPVQPPLRLQPLEPPLPQLRLTGLAGGRDHHVAMIMIDGALVTLAVGESSGEVRLERIVPPDRAELVVRGKRVELRIL